MVVQRCARQRIYLDWLDGAGGGLLFERLAHGNLFPCHGVLARRSVVEGVGGFDASMRHCHDWDLWVRIARAGVRFGRIARTLAVYRLVPGSLSRSTRSFFHAGLQVIRRAHAADPRVPRPHPEFTEGCTCSGDGAVAEWAFRCAGLALAQGALEEARTLIDTCREERPLDLTASAVRSLGFGLQFGSAIPAGTDDRLTNRVSEALLSFLLDEERRAGSPGLALKSLAALLRDGNLDGRRTALDDVPARDLLLTLLRRGHRRLSALGRIPRRMRAVGRLK